MNEEALNLSIRKFLKTVGINSQREIEHAVAKAAALGTIKGNIVSGNYIGLNATGNAAVANQTDGVQILFAASNNTIGGTTVFARNVISGNDNAGVYIAGDNSGPLVCSGNIVSGNYIGTDAAGTTPFGNSTGVYLGSQSTFYRLLRQVGEVRERRAQATHPAKVKPELVANGPNQVWSWDITKLLGPAKWTYYYLYVILDIYSRYVVGWMVASRESAAAFASSVEKAGGSPKPEGQIILVGK